MNNYIDLGNGSIQLPFGVLSGITKKERTANGNLQAVTLCEKNVIVTHAGDLYATYTQTPRRKHKPSVEFFESGLVKAVALETQQEVRTPIGELPAELVTFYDTGELHRVFPADGQISGFWTEKEEREMNIPLTFDLGFTRFTALVSSLCFYKSGEIKSITLFPGETLTVQTRYGAFCVRHGISLYQSGELRSFEPASPLPIPTPIGILTAYDPQGHGVHADNGSVSLLQNGYIRSLKTAAHKILAQPQGEALQWHAPEKMPHPCSDDRPYFKPLSLSFEEGTVTIAGSASHTYNVNACHFHITNFSDGSFGCSPADCASCSLCNH